MLPIDLLLVGDALDGPVDEIVEIQSLDHALSVYGGFHYTATTLASGATGYTLPYPAWGNDAVALEAGSDGALIPRELFEFSVSGAALTWTRNGDWDRYLDSPPAAPEIVFRARAIPGRSSLIQGALAAQGVPVKLHCLRLGGTNAAASASGLTFTARYPGSRYNGTTVTIASGTVTLTPAAGTGRVRVYHPATDQQLRELMAKDLLRGFQPLYLNGSLSKSSFTLPNGTWTLTGGADGTFTQALFQSWLQTYDLTGIDVVCPLGWTTTDVTQSGILPLIAEGTYPTLLVAQAPASGAALSGVVNSQPGVVSVAFQANYLTGSRFACTGDGAPMAAAVIASLRYGTTLASLPSGPCFPRYTQAQLHAAAASGHLVPYQSISKGEALWQGVTGDPLYSISTFRSLQEAARLVFTLLEPYLGQNLPDLAFLDQRLAQAFSRLQSGTVEDWALTREGGTLYLELGYRAPGEIQAVKLKLALGSAE